MSTNQTITTVRAKLDIIFRNGAHGKFPVGTLRTNIGTFACRDKWLETLDAGSYDGEFDIDEIELRWYRTTQFTPEFRFYQQAVVYAYRLDSMSDEVEETDYEQITDPMLEEAEATPVVVEADKPQTDTDELPVTTILANAENDEEMVLFIREQLRSVGSEMDWNSGDALTIPADLGRAEQRRIKDFLLDHGYKITDPRNRLWEVAEVTHA